MFFSFSLSFIYKPHISLDCLTITLDRNYCFTLSITTYVTSHFPSNYIIRVTEDKDGTRKSYDVVLSGNIKLEFNRQREITDIDSSSRLPDSVIPQAIRDYASENYPDNFITDWELEDNHQQVGLNNDVDLEFTMDGEFLRVDN